MTDHTENEHREDLPLPSPRSPDDLDRKILAYARDNAPEKAVFKPPFWLGGAATAAILMVALFITQTPLRQSEPGNVNSPAPTPARTLTPALMRNAATPLAEPKTADSDQSGVPAAKMEMARREKSLDRAMALEEERTGDSAAFSSIDNAVMDACPSGTDLASLINNCRDLIENGPADAALEICEGLLDTCGDCELPEDLQADIETLEAEHRP